MSEHFDILFILFDPKRNRAYIRDSFEAMGINSYKRFPTVSEIDLFIRNSVKKTVVILGFNDATKRDINQLRLISDTSYSNKVAYLTVCDEDFHYQNLSMLKDRIYNQVIGPIPKKKNKNKFKSLLKYTRLLLIWFFITISGAAVAYEGMIFYMQLRGSIQNHIDTGEAFLSSQTHSNPSIH